MTEEFTPRDEALQEGSLQERRESLLETTRELLAANDLESLRLILNGQHPADLAELFPRLNEEEQQQALQLLAEPLAAEMLADVDTPTMLSITEDLDNEALSDLVEEMAPDDAADVLGDLPAAQSEKVLELMEAEEAEEVRELLAHPDDTGGGIMTSRLVAVREDMTVAEAIAYLRAWAEEEEEEEVLYLYVVDEDDHLIGTVPLKRLLLASQDALIQTVTNRDLIAVRADMDREEIVQIFADYDLLALPVVDEEGRLVGRVTVDDIVDIIQEEATEDIYEMAAISAEELEERSAMGVVRRRLPWLLVCLAGTLVSGGVIDLFSEVLTSAGVLVLFVPAIMAMGGNSGIQTSTVTVRSLATGQLQLGNIWWTVWRELRVALSMGLFLGLLVFVVARVWTGGMLVGGCVGLAMFSAILVSAALGALIPLLFRRLGIDPAVASGPLITTLNDVFSLVIYFSIAVFLLSRWG